MVHYTTKKSREFILTWLIIISGAIDLLINCLINLILSYLSVNFHLNYFNMYGSFILFILILFTSYGIVYKCFDEYFWNNKHVLNYLDIHDLNGMWEGYTVSDFGKKDFKVTIKQTWTDIEMNLRTDQSSSELISFSFNKLRPIHDIYYIYESEVKQNQEEINTHYGTCILDIDENNEILSGTYFTDGQRRTYGDIYLKRIK